MSDYAGIASLELQKVGRLVSEEIVHFGGAPGTFPTWLDIERRTVHGLGSDPVAAARLLEAVVRGELGFSTTTGGFRLKPATTSSLRWLLLSGVWLGEEASIFIGRSPKHTLTLAKCPQVQVEGASTETFSSFRLLQAADNGVSACDFHGPRQAICVGNSKASNARSTIRFEPRDPEILKRLSATVEEFDAMGGSWREFQTAKVTQTMSIDVHLGPGEWKAYRFSTAG
jgi:hypothetical protein